MTLRAQKSECPHCAADTGDLTGKKTFHCEFCGRTFNVREVTDQEPVPDAVLDAQLQIQLKKMELDAKYQKQQEIVVHAPIQVENPFVKEGYRDLLVYFMREVKKYNHDSTTTYRMLRPRDLIYGRFVESYTSKLKAGQWTSLFDMTMHTVPPGVSYLMVGWFCNVDLGGGILRMMLNGMERSQTPAAFVFPVRQYLTPDDVWRIMDNDAVLFEAYNPTPVDVEGVIMPVAAIIGPASRLGVDSLLR